MPTADPPQVALVDYGLGNLRSVTRGLERAGAMVRLTDEPDVFEASDGVVLPGVGAFSEGMENAAPIRDGLLRVAASPTPLFGICLGMQMLLTSSEESQAVGQGDADGLDLVPGANVRFGAGRNVPHMGWNELEVRRAHPLVAGVDGEYAYFVHSYYAAPESGDAVLVTADYGDRFPAVIANEDGSVFGTQFHPEKSGTTGLRILENFIELCG